MTMSAPDDLLLAGDDVVADVGVDRRADLARARRELAQEPDQAAQIVALGKALALHQPALGEHRVGVEKPVGGDQVDAGMAGPARQQGAQDPGEGALADRDAARHPDHVRDRDGRLAQEEVGGDVQALARLDVQVEQPGERQVDVADLVE
jgi:hypothetical protein